MDGYYVGYVQHENGHVVAKYGVGQTHQSPIELLRLAFANGDESVLNLLWTEFWMALRLPDYKNIDAKVIIEAALEWARREIAPSAPSRLSSTFVFPSRTDAERFEQAYRKGGVIHRVKIMSGPTFTGDMALTNAALKLMSAPLAGQVAEMRGRAEAYWRADRPTEWPEVLCAGRVEVRGVA